MHVPRAIEIVSKVMDWRARKGVWPKIQTDAELRAVILAFKLVKAVHC